MNKTYLGIDLHKRSSVWTLLNHERKVLHEANVLCTPEHVKEAVLKLPSTPEEVSVAIEPVCGWRWYIEILEEMGMDVHVANPYKTRLIADSKLKNDKVDAKALAELLRADFLPESYKAPEDINNLRMIVRHRAYLVRMRTGIKNRIHGICTRKGLHLTSLKPLLKKGIEDLKNGSDEEIKDLLVVMKELDAHIDLIEEKMKAESKNNQTVKLMMTMPGIGVITGCSIYAEVGDFNRFASPSALSSYAGIIPRQRSSGASIRMGHITKMGSKVLRYSLVEASFRIRDTLKSKFLFSFYKRLAPKCGAKKARVALARKMLVILWHMVKNNTLYIDRSLKSTQSEVIS